MQKNSTIEREQKFEIQSQLSNLEVQDILESHNLINQNIEVQKDVYWDNDDCLITNLKRGLRVRYISGVLKSIEFKSLFIASNGNRVVEEISLLNSNGELDIEKLNYLLVERLKLSTKKHEESKFSHLVVLESYGLKPCIVLDKTRVVFTDENENVEVGLDDIDGLPLHIEVELSGDNLVYYTTLVESLASNGQLKLKPINLGYLDLISQQNPKLKSPNEFTELFKQNYSWNVLDTEMELVQDLLIK
jgi:adenylate cyclase class IV